MSFEGHFQLLCKNGHYECEDSYIFEPETWKCEVCGEGIAWKNLVDLTNGSFEGGERIDGYVELEIDKEFKCVCPVCNVAHQTEPTRYRIPEGKGIA